ncbi:hypothetical protein ACFL96_15135 [Thermoproteota archaeon]
MEHEYDSVNKIYQIVKLICIGLIILTGILITNKSVFNSLFQSIGYIPTVSIFIIHIISNLILLSSIVFITVFKLYIHEPILSLEYHNPKDVLKHWIIPVLILSTGITGIIIWTPFRWIIPSVILNLGGNFIFLAKNVHLWQMYLVIISLMTYLLLKLAHNGWQIRK